LALGWRCVPVCRTSAERTSTRPSSKQRLAPRLPVWCSKVALNGSTRRKAGTRLGPVPILFVLLVELPVSGRYWPCTIVRVFFFAPFHTKRATFSVCGAHCGACSARILRKFSLNVHALCMRRCWGGFGGVGLPLLQIVFWCTCVLQLPSMWSKEASVLAHQGAQEGSGTCDFFSNGNCGQVLCI